MRSKFLGAVVVAVGVLVAIPALADGKGAAFPMPAADFQAKVTARQTKARARMEERAAKLPADQASALRAQFDETQAKVNAEVAKAVADGTVTKEEAQAVRAAAPHHGGGHCNKDKPST